MTPSSTVWSASSGRAVVARPLVARDIGADELVRRGVDRSILAPSASSRRTASSTPRWSTAGRSDAALIRAAISRNERSMSARCGELSPRRSSSSIRRTFAIAAAAWSASARTRATFVALNADSRSMNAPIAPKTSSPATRARRSSSGCRCPRRRGRSRPRGRRRDPRGSRRSGRPRGCHRLAEHARPDRQPDRADPVAAALAPDPGIVGEAQVAGRRVHEVDHRAVGLEQPRRSRRRPRSAGRGSRPAHHPDRGSDGRWTRAPRARGRRRPGQDRGAGRLVARAWSVWPRPEDTPRPRRTGMAVRRWRLRHPADAGATRMVGRAGRASATTSCPRPPSRGAAAVTMPPTAGNPAGPTPLEVVRQMFASRTSLRPSDVALRALIVALALGTAYIHSTLGGLLFTLNAIGYVTAAVAIVIPLALAVRFRWVVRLGLIGYAATTIFVLGHQGPVLLHRLHRQGHRGRPDRRGQRRLRPSRRQPRRCHPPRAGRLRLVRRRSPRHRGRRRLATTPTRQGARTTCVA